MKKIFILLSIFFLVINNSFGATPTRTYTYTSGETINPSQVSTNEDNLYNYLTAGVEVIANNIVTSSHIVDGIIVGTDIASNAIDGTKIALGSDAQGDIMYYDGTNWVKLVAGTSGYFLKTQGAGANPVWGLSSEDIKFSVQSSVPQSNMATGGVTIIFDSEIFDTGSNFATNTFTAPQTAKYLLGVIINFNQFDQAVSDYDVAILTSNRTYTYELDMSKFSADLIAEWGVSFSTVADMDTSDTAYIVFTQSGGTAQVDAMAGAKFFGTLLN